MQQRMFSRRRLLLRIFAFELAAFCAGFFARFAQAQLTNGDVIGTFTDTSGAVIPGAKVTLTNTGTKVAASTTTNGTGDYTFNLLIPGQYTVTIEAKGFKKLIIPGFALAAGDRLRENANMEPGNVEETVEVTSAAPLLQTDSSTGQSTVTEQSVQDLPLNGRDFINLVQVQPGVNQGQPGAISSGQRPDDRAATSTVVANGQSDLYNNEMIDGMDNNEREQGFGVSPSIDAIAEVQVQTNDFSAEVGRSAGAVVNIITKSGTDTFHGSAFEYFRNEILNARDWFAKAGVTPKPEYRQNQFGVSLGGPIKRNRTFFFGDVQDNRVIQGLSSGLLTVPSVQENPGCPGNTTGNYDFTDNGGTVVPSAYADPVGKAYFSMFPCPNVSTTATSDNYENVVKQPQTTLSVDGRIDQHFSNGDTLFGRYSYNSVNTNVPGWFPAVQVAGLNVQPSGNQYGFPGDSTTKAHGVAFVYSRMLTPNLVINSRQAIRASQSSRGISIMARTSLPRSGSERQHDGGAEYDGTSANLLPHGRIRGSGRLGLHAHHRHQQYFHLRRLVDLYARRAQHQRRRADYPQTTQLLPERRAPALDRLCGSDGKCSGRHAGWLPARLYPRQSAHPARIQRIGRRSLCGG